MRAELLLFGTLLAPGAAAAGPREDALREEMEAGRHIQAMRRLMGGLREQNQAALSHYRLPDNSLRSNADVIRNYAGRGGPGFRSGAELSPALPAFGAPRPAASPSGAGALTVSKAFADLSPETSVYELQQAMRSNPALREAIRKRLGEKIREQKTLQQGADKEELQKLALIDQAIRDSEDLATPGKLNGLAPLTAQEAFARKDSPEMLSLLSEAQNSPDSLFVRVRARYRKLPGSPEKADPAGPAPP